MADYKLVLYRNIHLSLPIHYSILLFSDTLLMGTTRVSTRVVALFSRHNNFKAQESE